MVYPCSVFAQQILFLISDVFVRGGGKVRFGTAEICMGTHAQGIGSKLVWGKCSFMLLQFLGAPDPSCFSWHTSGAKLKVEKDMIELIRSHCWVFLRGGFRKLAWQCEETWLIISQGLSDFSDLKLLFVSVNKGSDKRVTGKVCRKHYETLSADLAVPTASQDSVRKCAYSVAFPGKFWGTLSPRNFFSSSRNWKIPSDL